MGGKGESAMCKRKNCFYISYARSLCNTHYAETMHGKKYGEAAKALQAFGATQGAWVEEAACRGSQDPEIFHDAHRKDQAIAICHACPVQRQCAKTRAHTDTGVWGGKAFYAESTQRTVTKRIKEEQRWGTGG